MREFPCKRVQVDKIWAYVGKKQRWVNARRMVVQESLPGLRPPSPAPRHVLGDCRLRDVDPKLEKFAMDTRCAPQTIGQAHLPDQAANLHWNLWPTASRARRPTPVQA